MKNWKTTLMGCLVAAVQALPDSPYKPLLTGFITSIGLCFAADASKGDKNGS